MALHYLVLHHRHHSIASAYRTDTDTKEDSKKLSIKSHRLRLSIP